MACDHFFFPFLTRLAQEALSAMQAMSERVIRGKPLRINFANIVSYPSPKSPVFWCLYFGCLCFGC